MAVTPPPQPHIAPIGPTNRYILLDDYTYEWDYEGERFRVVVSKSFEFDMASVPRIAWPLMSQFELGPAAFPHDWLYHHKGKLPAGSYQMKTDSGWENVPYEWPRRDVDRLFGRMMRESGVVPWRRRTAYIIVRLFGFCAWLT